MTNCANHPSREAHSIIAHLNKPLCLECINKIGDFDQFGPLSKPSKERDAAKANGAKVFTPKSIKDSTIIDGPSPMPSSTVPPPSVDVSNIPSEKKCSICGQTKSLSEFERDKRRPDGHGPRCKPCIKAKQKGGNAA